MSRLVVFLVPPCIAGFIDADRDSSAASDHFDFNSVGGPTVILFLLFVLMLGIILTMTGYINATEKQRRGQDQDTETRQIISRISSTEWRFTSKSNVLADIPRNLARKSFPVTEEVVAPLQESFL
eukprot:c11271_g1_i2.p1 GENE.c11271_g1_i2~~c11271_g1_i2.p1  ORF type:complete len:125 (+),score=26.39 c11271_g1_i2:45-419(+)